MPEWIKFPVVLTIVGLISAASLSGLYSLTLPKKKALEAEQTEKALFTVIPQAKEFDSVEDAAPDLPLYYVAKGEGQEVVGYAVEGEAEGYAGPIGVVVGVNKEMKIIGIKVYKQKETPGLGDKIVEVFSQKTWRTVITGTSPDESKLRPYFQEQFDQREIPVRLKRNGGDIEAITGATISSAAVVDAVNSAVSRLAAALGQAQDT